jgi:AcrR family transcriptional regulator
MAAMEEFTDKGYNNTSMDDIARAANVSKPILYQHFPSKRDLYLGILDDSVVLWVTDITDAIESESENNDRLRAAITLYFDRQDAADQAYRMLFEADVTADPDVRTRIEDVVSQVARVLGSEIAKQTSLSVGEANLVAAGLSGMAHAASWRWVKLGRPVSKEKAVELVFQLGWNGLTNLENQIKK